MKSQVSVLLHVSKGILKDALLTYPTLKDGFSRDFERLALYCRSRGLGFYTLDLPQLEAQLLRALECGSLSLEGPASRRVSKRIRVPVLFSGLWLLVFDRDGRLRQDVDVNAIFFLRQLMTIGKKLELGCTHKRTQSIVGSYHDIERELRNPSLRWACDSLGLVGSAHNGHNSHCECDGLLPLFDLPADYSAEEKSEELNHAQQPEVSSAGENRLDLRDALTYDRESSGSDLPLLAKREGRIPIGRWHEQQSDRRLLHQIQRVADLVVGSFDEFCPVTYSGEREELSEGAGFRHGPGAVAERLKNWEKSQFPNWPAKLESKFPFDYCGTTAGFRGDRPPNHEVASRLIAVPKTSKGPRLIAAEPTAHQWCQQLILSYLFSQSRKLFTRYDSSRARRRTYFIDFKDQSESGDLVLQASLNRNLATVDLSDASDRLTCWTVERVFRRSPSLLTALHAARTRYLRDDISEGSSFLLLRKFASQGTATTFPVMSLVMLCVALGSTLDGAVTWDRIWKLRNQVRVFGDDIIIPSHGYERMLRAMQLLQLKVNVAKSYVYGHFRESCGVDGYLGHDVTPVKPKTLTYADGPAECRAVIDTSNNLFNKGLWNASEAAIDLLPVRLRRRLRIVGQLSAGFAGLSSFCGSDESHLARRWNSRLHREEVRVWGSIPQTCQRERQGRAALLDFFARKHNPELARVVSNYADVRKARTRLLWEPVNPHAELDATLDPLRPFAG